MFKNTLEKITPLNANLIYFIGLIIAFVYNIYGCYGTDLSGYLQVIGTVIQIALPCYAIVPIATRRDGNGAKQMLLLLVLVLSITYILKFTVPIKRPYGGSRSFPSGHTAGAFIGAVFLSFRYGKKYALVTMPLACFVAFTRVYTRQHWISDVIMSIILCFIIGGILVKPIGARIQSSPP
jgi:membrane-associated phospholipid phosphatase